MVRARERERERKKKVSSNREQSFSLVADGYVLVFVWYQLLEIVFGEMKPLVCDAWACKAAADYRSCQLLAGSCCSRSIRGWMVCLRYMSTRGKCKSKSKSKLRLAITLLSITTSAMPKNKEKSSDILDSQSFPVYISNKWVDERKQGYYTFVSLLVWPKVWVENKQTQCFCYILKLKPTVLMNLSFLSFFFG